MPSLATPGAADRGSRSRRLVRAQEVVRLIIRIDCHVARVGRIDAICTLVTIDS